MHSTPSFQRSNCFGESDIFFLNGPNGGDNNHHDHHHPRESGRFSQLGRVVSRWGFVIARDGVNTKFLLTHHFPRLDWERKNDQMPKKKVLSKVIAHKLKHYNKWENMAEDKKKLKYEINKSLLEKTYSDHNVKFNHLINYMNLKQLKAYYVDYDDFYNNKKHMELFSSLKLKINDQNKLMNLMNTDYGTQKKYDNIINLNEIMKLKPVLENKYKVVEYKYKIKW